MIFAVSPFTLPWPLPSENVTQISFILNFTISLCFNLIFHKLTISHFLKGVGLEHHPPLTPPVEGGEEERAYPIKGERLSNETFLPSHQGRGGRKDAKIFLPQTDGADFLLQFHNQYYHLITHSSITPHVLPYAVMTSFPRSGGAGKNSVLSVLRPAFVCG
jgi:hypothetical protein